MITMTYLTTFVSRCHAILIDSNSNSNANKTISNYSLSNNLLSPGSCHADEPHCGCISCGADIYDRPKRPKHWKCSLLISTRQYCTPCCAHKEKHPPILSCVLILFFFFRISSFLLYKRKTVGNIGPACKPKMCCVVGSPPKPRAHLF